MSDTNDSTGLNFNLFDIQTMQGSEEGSTFVVIAKNKAVKLGIRLFLMPFQIKKSLWVGLAFRLRAEGEGFTVNSDLAEASFGGYPWYESKEHSSSVGILPLVAIPCSPAEVFNHYQSMSDEILSNLLDNLYEKVEKAGGVFLVEKDHLRMVLEEQIMDVIPDVRLTKNTTPEFILIDVQKKSEED